MSPLSVPRTFGLNVMESVISPWGVSSVSDNETERFSSEDRTDRKVIRLSDKLEIFSSWFTGEPIDVLMKIYSGSIWRMLITFAINFTSTSGSALSLVLKEISFSTFPEKRRASRVIRSEALSFGGIRSSERSSAVHPQDAPTLDIIKVSVPEFLIVMDLFFGVKFKTSSKYRSLPSGRCTFGWQKTHSLIASRAAERKRTNFMYRVSACWPKYIPLSQTWVGEDDR